MAVPSIPPFSNQARLFNMPIAEQSAPQDPLEKPPEDLLSLASLASSPPISETETTEKIQSNRAKNITDLQNALVKEIQSSQQVFLKALELNIESPEAQIEKINPLLEKSPSNFMKDISGILYALCINNLRSNPTIKSLFFSYYDAFWRGTLFILRNMGIEVENISCSQEEFTFYWEKKIFPSIPTLPDLKKQDKDFLEIKKSLFCLLLSPAFKKKIEHATYYELCVIFINDSKKRGFDYFLKPNLTQQDKEIAHRRLDTLYQKILQLHAHPLADVRSVLAFILKDPEKIEIGEKIQEDLRFIKKGRCSLLFSPSLLSPEKIGKIENTPLGKAAVSSLAPHVKWCSPRFFAISFTTNSFLQYQEDDKSGSSYFYNFLYDETRTASQFFQDLEGKRDIYVSAREIPFFLAVLANLISLDCLKKYFQNAFQKVDTMVKEEAKKRNTPSLINISEQEKQTISSTLFLEFTNLCFPGIKKITKERPLSVKQAPLLPPGYILVFFGNTDFFFGSSIHVALTLGEGLVASHWNFPLNKETGDFHSSGITILSIQELCILCAKTQNVKPQSIAIKSYNFLEALKVIEKVSNK